MKAWRLKEQGRVQLEEMESQPVGENCVKVKLLYCSLSITDRLLARGQMNAEYPLILGRQASAMVVETGAEVKSVVRGDIVAIKPLAVCSTCGKCSDGKYSDCENPLVFGVSEDGHLSDFAVLSAADLVKLPERVSPRDATFIDFIDIAIETVSRLNMDKGQFLVICGATQLGIIIAQVAMYYQIIPILTDINPAYLAAATELGLYYTINSAETDTRKRVFEMTGGKMADAAAYIMTSDYPLTKAFDFVRRGGGIAICGLEGSRQELPVSMTAVHSRRLNVIGICESNNNTAGAVNMLAGKAVRVESLIGAEIPFEAVGTALAAEITTDAVYLKTIVKM